MITTNHMKVYETGIRSGEYITSSATAKQNRGSLFQVKGDFPPSKSALPADDYDWSIFLQKLEAIPFFASLTSEERKNWLIQNVDSRKDLYLEDLPLQVKVLRLEGSLFQEKLSLETINMILAGNPEDSEGYWNLQDIYQMIPRKPGSYAHRHTLIFRPGNWQIYNSPLEDPEKLRSFTGLMIDLNEATFLNIVDEPVNYILPFNQNQLLGIRTERSTTPEEFPKDYNSIKIQLDWASPSIHKSLIQKLIRTGCREVITSNGKLFQSEDVFTTSFIMLLIHPGAFVPDIQRFVTGQESALKRLAVTICEDSYVENYAEIMTLYAAALLTQVHSSWKPTSQQIDRWVRLGLNSMKDIRYYRYSTQVEQPLKQLTPFSLSYLLIKEVRSFQTDINMVSTIDGSFEEGENLLIEPMPLVHCLDHHNITDLAYHFKRGLNISYLELFKIIWEFSSGVNPRKGSYFSEDYTLKCIRDAQNLLWKAKTTISEERDFIPGETTVTYTLSNEWLAGMLGPVLLNGKQQILVSLHPDDLNSFVPVKKPSRNSKNVPQLSPEEDTTAINKVQNILRQQGLPLKVVPNSLPWLKGASLHLYQGEYVIQLADRSLHLWNDIRATECSFKHHSSLETSLNNAIKYRGNGISENAEEEFQKILQETPATILRRLLFHLSTSRSTISLFKISRTGAGQEYAVSPLDTEIFHILSTFTVLYPGAIQKTNTRQFKVRYGPLIWNLREQIEMRLASILEHNTYGEKEWGVIYDRQERNLWPHQVKGWRKMEDQRGHLLWIPVGMGKTLIVMRYFQSLIEKGEMSQYVIYTLPPSAIENTVREVTAFGFRVNLLDLRVTGSAKEHKILPYTVNLVKQDHLRLAGDLFRDVAEKSFFVVDEFHLTLNKTIRTSLALELVKTSYDFIGLSGTIIQSENVEDLIEWLQQIVDFEVTKENFWVAVSAMISNRVETKIPVSRHTHEVEMPFEKKETYLSLVGTILGGRNPKPSQADFRAAIKICYEICLNNLVNICIAYYNQGESILLVAKDIQSQEEMKTLLLSVGMPPEQIILLGKDCSIAVDPHTPSPIRVAITTVRHSTGYTFTKARTILTSIYFSNQATREQLEGRINRIGQTADKIYVITVHTGVLTHILQKYENARTLSEALKQLAPTV
jgi:hypothetical protein